MNELELKNKLYNYLLSTINMSDLQIIKEQALYQFRYGKADADSSFKESFTEVFFELLPIHIRLYPYLYFRDKEDTVENAVMLYEDVYINNEYVENINDKHYCWFCFEESQMQQTNWENAFLKELADYLISRKTIIIADSIINNEEISGMNFLKAL